MTINDIIAIGRQIAAETAEGGNTAARVGGVIEAIGEALKNQDYMSWQPAGDFDIETYYEKNDQVFDAETNSCYLSLQTDNVGHPVNENDEAYEEGWWMKVLDGSSIIAAAEAATQAAAEANQAAEAARGIVYQAVDDHLDTESLKPVANQVVTQAINNLSSNLQDVDNKTYYINEVLNIDTTSMTKTPLSLGENKRWLNQGGNNHVVIPCQENDIFKIKVTKVTLSGTGGFYGWLTNAYKTPTSQAVTPYTKGEDRHWLNLSVGEITITAPADAAYLCLVTKDGSQHVCTWVGTRTRQESLRARLQDVVEPSIEENAEAIAALNVKPSYAPSSFLPIKETHQRYMGVLGTQGSALYNDTLVIFYAASDGNRLRFYNLNTKQLLSSNLLPTFNNPRVHGNTLTFSKTFYDENDNFPLLYLCSGYTDTAEVSTSEVYVIRISNDYTLSLIQTITLDFGIVNAWTEFVVDNVKNRAWIMGSGIANYICVKLPGIASSAVTINSNTAIIDKFNVPSFNLGNTTRSSGQGRFFYHNRIYHVSGIPQESGQGEFSTFVCVTNVLTHVIECVLPLVNFGLTNGTSYDYEPESCFIWNDEFYVVFRGFVEKLIF